MEKLTQKQKAFVAEYMKDLNAFRAAERAGYQNPNIGRQLIAKNNVSEAIREAQEAREKRTLVTADYVISNLREIVERSMQRAPVLNMKGEQVQDDEGNNLWQFDAKNANRSLELLGKHLGIFVEKQEISGAGGDPVRIILFGDQGGK